MVRHLHHRLHAGLSRGMVLHVRFFNRVFLILALKAHCLFHDRRRRPLSNALFKFLHDGQKIAGFKRLDDDAVGLYSICVLGLIWLHLADGQQHRNLQRLQRAADFFADFQAGISRHINIKDDDVRFLFRDLLHRGCAVAHSHNVIAGFRKDLFAHVLGCHAVVGE